MYGAYYSLGNVHGKSGVYSLDHSGSGSMVFRLYNLDRLDSWRVVLLAHNLLYNVDKVKFCHLGNEFVHISNHPKRGKVDTVELVHQCNLLVCRSSTMVYSTNEYRPVCNLLHIYSLERFQHFFSDTLIDQYLSKSTPTISKNSHLYMTISKIKRAEIINTLLTEC